MRNFQDTFQTRKRSLINALSICMTVPLKSNVDKLHLDKLKNVPTNLSNLKSKVDKLDVDKAVPVPFDLSKLKDLVK